MNRSIAKKLTLAARLPRRLDGRQTLPVLINLVSEFLITLKTAFHVYLKKRKCSDISYIACTYNTNTRRQKLLSSVN